MHTYPAWRLWLVAVVVAAALLLALPNVFGDAPALHLSRDDRAAFTDQTQATVTSILEQKGIPVDAAWLEDGRLVLRFDDVAQQQQARDAINAAAQSLAAGCDVLLVQAALERRVGKDKVEAALGGSRIAFFEFLAESVLVVHVRLGDAMLQVSRARTPCWKIDRRLGAEGVTAYIAIEKVGIRLACAES